MRSIFLSHEQVFEKQLPIFKAVGTAAPAADLALLTTPDAEKTAQVERVCVCIADELRREWLSAEADNFLVTQAFAVQSGIADPQLRSIDVSFG